MPNCLFVRICIARVARGCSVATINGSSDDLSLANISGFSPSAKTLAPETWSRCECVKIIAFTGKLVIFLNSAKIFFAAVVVSEVSIIMMPSTPNTM